MKYSISDKSGEIR